jgi:hypothetical protein
MLLSPCRSDLPLLLVVPRRYLFLMSLPWSRLLPLPQLGVAKLASSTVSRDPLIVRSYRNDPLVYHGTVCVSVCVCLVVIQRCLIEREPEWCSLISSSYDRHDPCTTWRRHDEGNGYCLGRCAVKP